jgi:hypothetical protein
VASLTQGQWPRQESSSAESWPLIIYIALVVGAQRGTGCAIGLIFLEATFLVVLNCNADRYRDPAAQRQVLALAATI